MGISDNFDAFGVPPPEELFFSFCRRNVLYKVNLAMDLPYKILFFHEMSLRYQNNLQIMAKNGGGGLLGHKMLFISI